MIRVARTISFWSGVSPVSTALVRWAIRPTSVFIPVAKTTAFPDPLTTVVPAKAMLELSINSPSHGAAVRGTGSDSPVREALLTMRNCVSINRASAGTLSPPERITRSPGATSGAGISLSWPPRIARTRNGSSSLSFSTARSALCSCAKVKTPLMKMTATMAKPSVSIPSPGWSASEINASAAATQRISARKWVNCLPSFERREGFPIS